MTNFLAEGRLCKVRNAHIQCPLKKFPQQCRSGIIHIREDHLGQEWKTPKDVVWTVFWCYTQNQCLACGLAIGKMFANQSLTENKAVINGETVQICCSISQPRLNISQNPSVTRCSVWYRLLNPFQNFEKLNSRSKNGFW